MDIDYKAFLLALGKRVKKFRKDRGWSLRDMVILHGYHDSQWRKYESGGGMTVPSLLRIAAIFHVSISELLDGLAESPLPNGSPIKEKPKAKSVNGSAKSAGKKTGLGAPRIPRR